MKKHLYIGTIEFEVIGGLGERFFNQCVQAGLCVEKIRPTSLGFLARTQLRFYNRLRKLARVNKCRIRVTKRNGVSFFLARFAGHWGILIGILLAVGVFLGGQRLIWSITFVDFTIPEQIEMRKELSEYGIYEGSVANEDYLDSVADQLFVSRDDLSWFRLNFVHGRLVVEKVDRTQQPEMESQELTEIVAACDGIIVRQEIDGGFAQKQAGQSVAQGEILVSGCTVGKTGALLYGNAAARIYAEVEKEYQVTQPLMVSKQMPGPEIGRQTKLLIAGRSFSFPWQKEPQDTRFQQTTIDSLTLWGFHFPASLEHTVYRDVQQVSCQLSPELAQAIAEQRIYQSVSSQFDTFKILDRSVTVEQTDEAVTVRMHLTMEADIARTVPFSGFAGNAEKDDKNL